MNRIRKTLLIVGISALALSAAAAVVLGPGSQSPPTNAADRPTTDTVKIARGALVERSRVSGTLAFAARGAVGTALTGTVTAIPAIGTVIGQGAELFRIDDDPVLLMIGALPQWRDFEFGMDDGRDVLQLEQNLNALGFFTHDPDDKFSWSTANAIEKWQHALGLDETGRIERGRIVFSTGPVRVATHSVAVGAPSGGAVMTVTGTERQVTAFVTPNLRASVEVGAKIDLTLPDGTVTKGTVVAVGNPIEREDGSGGSALKLPVTVTLDDPASAENYTDVSVGMQLVRVLSEDALLVPVLALLARGDGEYAVEVQHGSKTKFVGVELGGFADGMVEVRAGDIAAGDVVVVGR